MKKRYIAAALLGAVLAVSGCECLTCGNGARRAYYPVQGVNAYKGQSVTALFNTNGAPNTVKNLANGDIMWTYYTNYRPVGGGEMIRQAPMGRGPLTTLSKSLDALAQDILAGKGGETLWAQPDFPRIFYQLAGNLGFRQQARKNGLRGRDISS